jgi:hypothetical protein
MNEQPVISKEEMAKLLGRSLTTIEDTNYNLYLGLATTRIMDLLCLTELPASLEDELKLLIARCFGIIGVEQKTSYDNVESKKVEDFSVTYDNSSEETPMSKFVKINGDIIAKYSNCRGTVVSGKVFRNDCIRYI